jgi:hypothetical protein
MAMNLLYVEIAFGVAGWNLNMMNRAPVDDAS